MPFCPKCRYEYRRGIEYCPDCDERLVETLPPENKDETFSPDDIKDWVPLARLTAYQYAEMVQEGLRDKGIPVVILSETGHFGLLGQLNITAYRPIGGGYVVLVPPDFAEDADQEAELMLGDEWVKSRLE